MTTEIKSPTFPESVADGTIANWVKKEGDSVKQDEVIAEIETDKVVLEVVAPFDGVVSKVLKPAGETVLSAELIAEFRKEDINKVSDAPKNENIAEPEKEKAVETITLNAAKVLGIEDNYGSIEVGKSATLFISHGDALDMRTNNLSHAYIDGREVSLETNQTKLWQRYKKKVEEEKSN